MPYGMMGLWPGTSYTAVIIPPPTAEMIEALVDSIPQERLSNHYWVMPTLWWVKVEAAAPEHCTTSGDPTVVPHRLCGLVVRTTSEVDRLYLVPWD